ncbi:MAG: hypothetical protein ACP5T0_08570 [Verrucomicrobiia bacterium]
MKKGGEGGGNTITGLNFEIKSDLSKFFERIPDYKINQNPDKAGLEIYYNDSIVARCFKKHEFYKFLEENNIKWNELISTKLLPDTALLIIINGKIFIIEIKYQEVQGSVDEKLQTCDFKKRQYEKLVKNLNLKVEFVYLLNDWFKQKKYEDVLEYVKDVGCHYFFNEIPLKFLGLPY